MVDGTHIKANANNKKVGREEVEVEAKRYAEELMEEVNADRIGHGKKPFATEEEETDEKEDNGPPTTPKKKRETTAKKKLKKRKKEAKKKTIERVFADAKEKHGMRYARYTGLAQVTNLVKLKFADMNLKKFVITKWEDAHNLLQILIFWPQYA